jgi:sugar phosphate permease
MGLLFASGGIAGFLFPPMISCFISGAGWRMSWVFLAAIHLILAVILAGIMIRNTPEELGQVPDGAKKSLWPDRVGFLSTGTTYSTPVDWTLGEALRSPVLWLLIGIVSIVFFVSTLLSAHQVAYLLDLKYSPMVSASAFGLMLGTSIVGRVLSGVLGMRFSGRYLAMFFLTLLCLGVVFLIAAREIIFVYLYAIFVGIGMGGMIVLAPSLIGAYFGRTNYPRISGWTMPVATVAFASAPVAAGYLYDITGTYLLPFGITAGLLFICVILAFFARPPQKKELENKRV